MNREYTNEEQIFNNVINKKWADASEGLVDLCKKKYSFHTTRSDDAPEIWVYIDGIYVSNGRTVIKEFCRNFLHTIYTPHLVNIVTNKIEADTYIDQDKFFNTNIKEEIAVKNGILNMESGALSPFTPEKVFFSKINANYDPAATCEKIDQFFHEVLADENDVKTIYELFGFCLFKEYFVERGFMFLGSGRNGKGKVLNILKHFLSEENVIGIPLHKLESGEFKECELMNKLANIAGDISCYPIKESSKFKGLTGRDVITASRKFKTGVSFVNYAKLIFSTNNLPKTYDLSVGFFDRWVYLTFPYTFKTKAEYDKIISEIPDAEKKFYKLMDEHRIDGILSDQEMSGLLNKALDGLDRLHDTGTFTSSKSGDETKKFWIRNSDSFFAFATEHLEVDCNSKLEKEELRKEYQKYCKKNKIVSEGDKHIKEILVRQFTAGEERVGSDPYNQRYAWTGIRLKGPILTIGGGYNDSM